MVGAASAQVSGWRCSRMQMPGLLWVVKEVDVVASIAYTDEEFAQAVSAVAAGALDPVGWRPTSAHLARRTDPSSPSRSWLSPTRP